MAVQQRRFASLHLTLKIVQLVNRLKSRVSGVATKQSLLGSKTCLGLESKALRSIQKGLSRVNVSSQGRKQLQHCANANRICKTRRSSRPSSKLHTPGRYDSAYLTSAGEDVQDALRALDLKGNISHSGIAFSTVCSDDRRFLQHDGVNFDGCSLDETVQSLVLVSEAINVLYAARSQFDDAFIVAQGAEIGLSIDESFIANYEHLLLRLQSELIEALTRKVVEALLENNLDKTQRRLLNWFTEFPDNQHPLTTTWPWGIKPSLAVLWGVCWMFYNNKDSVSRDQFLQADHFRGWDAPQPNEYLNYGLELIGTTSQPAAPQGVGGGDSGTSGIGGRARLTPYPDLSVQARTRAQARPSRATQPLNFNWPSVVPGLPGGPALSPARPTYYDVFSPPGPLFDNSLPENPGIATDLFAFPQQRFVPDNDSWQYAQPPLPQHQHLQHQSSGHLNVPGVPGIRVSGESGDFAQPQSASYYDLYASAHQQLHLDTNFPPYNNMGAETSPIHSAHSVHSDPGIGHGHARSSSIHSTIMTPVSMAPDHSPMLSPNIDRRPSVASPRPSTRHPSPSEESTSQDDDAALSPRKPSTHKRAEEPTRNAEGKLVCKFPGCSDHTFDRKCEWSKHMDKHDRPYKCAVKGCEKLQGFTYSGGLLRHEREVHKMHGGTKKSLYCPFPDCKRSSGSGFTRKENLAEHIRRVHRRTSTSSDLGHMVIAKSEDDGSESQMPLQSPYQRNSNIDLQDDERKRKRTSDGGASEASDQIDLRAEVKRLRRENEAKEERLKQLEQAMAALQRQGQR